MRGAFALLKPQDRAESLARWVSEQVQERGLRTTGHLMFMDGKACGIVGKDRRLVIGCCFSRDQLQKSLGKVLLLDGGD